jgi:hypothetical protein
MSAFDPFEGFQVTVATSGTAVEFNPQPRTNTHTILVYNGTDNNVFLAWQTSAAAINATNGVIVPSKGSVQLAVGPSSLRPSSGAATLRADASANGTAFSVAYVNGVSF